MYDSGAELYRAWLAGDGTALERLVGAYSDALVRFAHSYTGETTATTTAPARRISAADCISSQTAETGSILPRCKAPRQGARPRKILPLPAKTPSPARAGRARPAVRQNAPLPAPRHSRGADFC